MPNILLLGAGRSVYSLAQYLKNQALELDINLRVGDLIMENAQAISNTVPNSTYFQFDITSDIPLLTQDADVVISMLPAHLHGKVALTCLESNTHLITASYINPQIEQLQQAVKDKNLHFVMECGLDPGIDHMSAKKLLDQIQEKGGRITQFKSFTGGLVAPESNDNPWGYKFSWSPRNIVLAGQGVVKFKKDNRYKYLPYSSVFKHTEEVHIPNYGVYEAYANRNSLHYLDAYQLTDCPSVFRGTLRQKGFCQAWDFLITLGLTNDSFTITHCKGMSYRDFVDSFLPNKSGSNLEEKIKNLLPKTNDTKILEKLHAIGIFDDTRIELSNASPAQILQAMLETKWVLKPEDKDLVLMQHEIEYEIGNQKYRAKSWCGVQGDNARNTAMAKTVGIPVGIVCKLILQQKLSTKGIVIPTLPELYQPILAELQQYNVKFETSFEKISGSR